MRSNRNYDDEASDYYRKKPRDEEERGYYNNNRFRDRERRRSRSRSRSQQKDLYKDLIEDDSWNREKQYERKNRDRDRERRDYDNYDRRDNYRKNYHGSSNYNDDYHSDESENDNNYGTVPNNKVIVRSLALHITEADIQCDLIMCGLKPLSIRLIRRKKTGASRGFAFVEFATEDEARSWIEKKQVSHAVQTIAKKHLKTIDDGVLMLQDQYRATIQYSRISSDSSRDKQLPSDWFCGKCGVFNFKRRDNCFKCYASREESEKGGEGSDEISNILTKKIMFRNLDALTNEEKLLCVLQEKIPTMVSTISKILICRDPLTQISRGIGYLYFDNLVDSMNTFNALKALDEQFFIDNREVLITYCMDSENRALNKQQQFGGERPKRERDNGRDDNQGMFANNYQYTQKDVPKLAEYSTNLYAQTPAERESYMAYYTDYYKKQIVEGSTSNLPSYSQFEANSGAAVAQSAIERKHKLKTTEIVTAATATSSYSSSRMAASVVKTPNGKDGKKYPPPDASVYQYDETSGYYYDPTTGLYYDATSQYYYNTEIAQFVYWDPEKETYILAPAAGPASDDNKEKNGSSVEKQSSVLAPPPPPIDTSNNGKKQKDYPPQDKVKVAKKIVKDMEKWAKQLNARKDYIPVTTAQMQRSEDSQSPPAPVADVGFTILEKKDRTSTAATGVTYLSGLGNTASNKLATPSYGSDSDNEHEDQSQQAPVPLSEKDYVDFEKLTCLLCKRAFQSAEILSKHLKASQLHKDNLQKFKLTKGDLDEGNQADNSQSYRDRAKERRKKYGEVDPVPVNRSKERFQREMEKQASIQTSYQAKTLASQPISESNVGNKLLQKMGWKEGTGLGRTNQGRTEIIETEARVANAGLGSKHANFAAGAGDDYKTYIKKQMQKRYSEVQ